MKKLKCYFAICFLLFTITLFGCGCKHENLTELYDTATCESNGTITYECNQCGKKVEKPSPKKGHDYSIFLSDSSTCEKDGELKNKCSRCSSVKTISKKAIGHNGTIKCKNCNQNFYILLYPYLNTKSFVYNYSSSVNVTTTITFSKENNEKLSITSTRVYSHPISCESKTLFTIKPDGAWSYTVNVKYTGYASGQGTLSGELPNNKLYRFTSNDIENKSIELPVTSFENNNFYDLLYDTLKTDFCDSLLCLKNTCTVNGKITMSNLGFVNF